MPLWALFTENRYITSHMCKKRRLRGCVCPTAESINVSLAPEVFFKYNVNRIQKFLIRSHIYNFPAFFSSNMIWKLKILSLFLLPTLLPFSLLLVLPENRPKSHPQQQPLVSQCPTEAKPLVFRLLWRNLKRIGSIASPAYMRGIWKGVGCVWSFLFPQTVW